MVVVGVVLGGAVLGGVVLGGAVVGGAVLGGVVVLRHLAPFPPLWTEGVAKPRVVSVRRGMVAQATAAGVSNRTVSAPPRALARPWAPAPRAPSTCAFTTPAVTPSRLPRPMAMIAVRCQRLARRAAARWPCRLEAWEGRALDITVATFSFRVSRCGPCCPCHTTPAGNYRVDAPWALEHAAQGIASGPRRDAFTPSFRIQSRVLVGGTWMEGPGAGTGPWILGFRPSASLGGVALNEGG